MALEVGQALRHPYGTCHMLKQLTERVQFFIRLWISICKDFFSSDELCDFNLV